MNEVLFYLFTLNSYAMPVDGNRELGPMTNAILNLVERK